MTELSIVVPLSALPPGVELTAEGLLAALTDGESYRVQADEAKADAAQHKQRYNDLVAAVQPAGRDLTRILDEVEGYDQARTLRRFAQELTEFGSATRQLP